MTRETRRSGTSSQPAERYTVFLASNFEEFRELRASLKTHIEDLYPGQIEVLNLDDRRADERGAVARSTDLLENADLCVVLIGDAYGTVPDDDQVAPSERGFGMSHIESKQAVQQETTRTLVFETEDAMRSQDPRIHAWLAEMKKERIIGTLQSPDGNDSMAAITKQIIERFRQWQQQQDGHLDGNKRTSQDWRLRLGAAVSLLLVGVLAVVLISNMQRDPNEVTATVVQSTIAEVVGSGDDGVVAEKQALSWEQVEDPFICDGVHHTQRQVGNVAGFEPGATIQAKRIGASNVGNANPVYEADRNGVVQIFDDCDPSRASDPYDVELWAPQAPDRRILVDVNFSKPDVTASHSSGLHGSRRLLDGETMLCTGDLGVANFAGFNSSEIVRVSPDIVGVDFSPTDFKASNGAVSVDLAALLPGARCDPGAIASIAVRGLTSDQTGGFNLAGQ